jgi:hypothetical protein
MLSPAPRRKAEEQPKNGRLRFGRFHIPLPHSRVARILLGIALVIGGALFFLPVLGLWMLPLGILVLSAEVPAIGRFRRKAGLWWARRKAKIKEGPGD